jgi:hypothetical protein
VTLLMLAACAPPRPGVQQAGAKSPKAAVESFLAAVRAQDLQAMAAVWGTDKGPARDAMAPDRLEKSELIMMCYFNHDKFRIGRESVREGKQLYAVDLSKGPLNRTTTFYTVKGPSSRWFVENADIAPVQDFCRQAPAARP